MKKRTKPVHRARLNLRLDSDLKEWAHDYARRKGTDITKIVREYLLFLREQEMGSEGVEQI